MTCEIEGLGEFRGIGSPHTYPSKRAILLPGQPNPTGPRSLFHTIEIHRFSAEFHDTFHPKPPRGNRETKRIQRVPSRSSVECKKVLEHGADRPTDGRGGDRRTLPGGTGPVLRPHGMDSLQGDMGPKYRTHASHDQNRQVLEKLDRATTWNPFRAMVLSRYSGRVATIVIRSHRLRARS